MAASKARIDWALLLLRVAAGGAALLHGFSALQGVRGLVASQAQVLLLALLELVGGVLLLLGVWVVPAGLALAGLLAWPLVAGWTHGAPLLARTEPIFRVLGALACALGGGGRWAFGKG